MLTLSIQMDESQNSCDEYLRCRSEMHLAVDGCAERFASSKVDLAESADTIVLRVRFSCYLPRNMNSLPLEDFIKSHENYTKKLP